MVVVNHQVSPVRGMVEFEVIKGALEFRRADDLRRARVAQPGAHAGQHDPSGRGGVGWDGHRQAGPGGLLCGGRAHVVCASFRGVSTGSPSAGRGMPNFS